jgi:chloramphenicol 3-O-phosphotransferase
LEKLDAYFCPRASGVHLRREFLLYGMGGSGKSQIALKFAELFEQR